MAEMPQHWTLCPMRTIDVGELLDVELDAEVDEEPPLCGLLILAILVDQAFAWP